MDFVIKLSILIDLKRKIYYKLIIITINTLKLAEIIFYIIVSNLVL